MRRNYLALLLVCFAAGCVSPPPPTNTSSPAAVFVGDGLITQRAVLSVRGRQFALNGYLAQSASGGERLIITEMFGQVIADVLVKPDGSVLVMRSSRLFRPTWISRYVASDMQCIFGGTPKVICPVQKLSATHFFIARRWYKLDLQIVETKPGPQPVQLFDEKIEPIK
jgi:hypothetical protein